MVSVSVAVLVLLHRVLEAHDVLHEDTVLVVVLGIVESGVEVGHGVDLGDVQLVVAPFENDGCAGRIGDEYVEVHPERSLDVVLLRHGDGLLHCGAVVEDVTHEDGVSDRDLSIFGLVHEVLPLLDVELQDRYGEALLVESVHANIREQDQRGDVRLAVIEDACAERTLLGIEPIGIRDTDRPVLALGGAVDGHVQSGVVPGWCGVPVVVVPGGEDTLAVLVEGDERRTTCVVDPQLLEQGVDGGVVVVVVVAVHLV